MNKLTAVVAAAFAAAGLTLAAPADAATVLAAEGLMQRSGKTQTAFSGAFCRTNTCRSVNSRPISLTRAVDKLNAGVAATPTGDLILMGWSHGGATVDRAITEWDSGKVDGPDADRVVLVVRFGNPYNKLGGSNRKQVQLRPTDTDYAPQLEVIAQYDYAADQPARRGYWSQRNLAAARHFSYFEKGFDLNAPENLVWTDGDTTYMLVPAKDLPMLKGIKPWVSAQRYAQLDAKYRPLIEKDYDRPAYVEQGEGADWYNTGSSDTDPASVPASVSATLAEPQERTSTRRAADGESGFATRVARQTEQRSESVGSEDDSSNSSDDKETDGHESDLDNDDASVRGDAESREPKTTKAGRSVDDGSDEGAHRGDTDRSQDSVD